MPSPSGVENGLCLPRIHTKGTHVHIETVADEQGPTADAVWEHGYAISVSPNTVWKSQCQKSNGSLKRQNAILRITSFSVSK